MNSITLLIKPASSSCNMRCEYCFYLDTSKNREIASYGIMSLITMDNIIRKTFAINSRQYTFAFQGGEPTLAGLDFYEKFVESVNKYNRGRYCIRYVIQTNGYNVNGEWIGFLAKHNFLVGVSLDGFKDVHDLYRGDNSGKGTYSKVLRTLHLLEHQDVEFNVLTVVTAQVAKKIAAIYGFYKRNKILYQQYIPCLDPLLEERGYHPYSLTPELYGDFLCTLFDVWYNDFIRGIRVSISFFDDLLLLIAGYPPESCGMMGQCTRQIVVEADGSVYPCDFYTLDKYRLGNLNVDDFQQIEKNRDSIGFIKSSEHVSSECEGCRWRLICRGGCRRYRESALNTRLSLNYLCEAYKRFYDYSLARLKECAISKFIQI